MSGLRSAIAPQANPEGSSRSDSTASLETRVADLESYNRGMRRLVTAVQELSHARTLESIMKIVRTAARELTGADGATFILRDKDQCHYADEDAISPLWKGQRFPLSACISGWAMLNRKSAIIEDIYADARIPADAYRPTFVKSLVMVPIRTAEPLGAIGNYWAQRHLATAHEVELLQALANTTAVAMESVALYQELESRVQDRTRELQAANRELETFSYSASHDLQGPLSRIKGFCDLITRRGADGIDPKIATYLQIICAETDQMRELIQELLKMSRLARVELHFEKVDLSQIATDIAAILRRSHPDRHVEIKIQEGLVADGHPALLRVVLDNLLSNAWKFTSKVQGTAVIEFGSDGKEFFLKDNGAGFDMTYAEKLFQAFQRMHSQSEFPGTGVGLATVQRIIQRHGGQIRAESSPGKGASFHFTLPAEIPVALKTTKSFSKPILAIWIALLPFTSPAATDGRNPSSTNAVTTLRSPLTGPTGRTINTITEWEKRRVQIKQQWQLLLGEFPKTKPPLDARTISTETLDGFTRSLVKYQVEAGAFTDGYLLEPIPRPTKSAAIVVFHPTTPLQAKGVAAVDPSYPTDKRQGMQLVKLGFVVWCPRNYINTDGNDWAGNARLVKAAHPNWTGMTRMVWDAIRAADFVESLPEVDGRRIGCLGHSLGAKVVLYAMAFDERYKAGVFSEGGIGLKFSNWDAPWYLGPKIRDSNFGLENDEILAMIAPRAFLLLAGDSADSERSRAFIDAAMPVYGLFGAANRLQWYDHHRGHAYPPEARELAERFLREALK